MSAVDLIKKCDSKDAFFFIDPPYELSRRKSKENVYRHEMNEDQHRELIEVLLNLKGKAAVCGYDGGLYDQLEQAGWQKQQRKTHTLNGSECTETLWTNYKTIKQMDMFDKL
jgi:DNA adenine methylase